jgi:hypothetical protein
MVGFTEYLPLQIAGGAVSQVVAMKWSKQVIRQEVAWNFDPQGMGYTSGL